MLTALVNLSNTSPLLYGCVTILALFSPVFVGGGYLLYQLFLKGLASNKKIDEETQQEKEEQKKIWFYNLWLPLIICTASFMVAIMNFVIVQFSQMGNIAVFSFFPILTGTSLFFCVFYPFYRFFHFIYARITSQKYYPHKMSLVVLGIGLVISVISFVLATPYLFSN